MNPQRVTDYLARWYDVLEIWRDWAGDVRGHAIDCGHFLAEGAPDETFEQLRSFFDASY
jgi:haloacetate dehalogenase